MTFFDVDRLVWVSERRGGVVHSEHESTFHCVCNQTVPFPTRLRSSSLELRRHVTILNSRRRKEIKQLIPLSSLLHRAYSDQAAITSMNISRLN